MSNLLMLISSRRELPCLQGVELVLGTSASCNAAMQVKHDLKFLDFVSGLPICQNLQNSAGIKC